MLFPIAQLIEITALKDLLAQACPKGIDVYFERVGCLRQLFPLLNPRSRIPLCGLIAHYNDREAPQGRVEPLK